MFNAVWADRPPPPQTRFGVHSKERISLKPSENIYTATMVCGEVEEKIFHFQELTKIPGFPGIYACMMGGGEWGSVGQGWWAGGGLLCYRLMKHNNDFSLR